MRIKSYEEPIADPSNYSETLIWEVDGMPGHMLRMAHKYGHQYRRVGLDSFDGSLTISVQARYGFDQPMVTVEIATVCGK
jgi:hypothetical protein